MVKQISNLSSDSFCPTRVRIAIYARYSSDRQNPTSADDQVNRIKRRIDDGRLSLKKFPRQDHEYEVLEIWIKKDEAKSGTTTVRSGYEAILKGIENKEFDAIIVDDISRLARDLGDLLDFYKLLKFYGVELYSVADGLSSEDANAKTSFTVKGMVADMGNEAHANRTKRGQEQKKVDGFSTGDICYGYGSEPTIKIRKGGREVDANFRLFIKPNEAHVVNEIYDLYLQGRGVSGISHYLNERKIPSSKRAQARTGKLYNWGPSAINLILNNAKYIGEWTWGKYRQVKHPITNKKVRIPQPESEWVKKLIPDLAIVPREKWEAVQAKLRKKKRLVESGNNRAESMRLVKTLGTNCEAILSSVLRCYLCNGPLLQVSGKGSGYYGCYMHHRKDRTQCGNRRLLPRVLVDQAVIEKLKTVLTDPTHLEQAASKYNHLMRERLRVAPTRHNLLKDRLLSVEAEIGNLISFIMTSGASVPTSVRDTLADKELEKHSIVSQLEVLDQVSEDRTFLTPFALKQKMEGLKSYLDRDPVAANRIMKLFFPDGLLARPAAGTEQTRCNPHKNPWTITGVVIVSPESRFTDLEYGGSYRD